MGYIADEIHRAITDNYLESHLLPPSYVEDLRTSIIKQYCTKNTTFMWESFKDCVNYQNSNAWSLICNYVKDNECIMFFDESDDKNAFLISNGTELQKILEDSFGFEFYITDKLCSYLICFNHHDILYGSGEAKEWVKKIKLLIIMKNLKENRKENKTVKNNEYQRGIKPENLPASEDIKKLERRVKKEEKNLADQLGKLTNDQV